MLQDHSPCKRVRQDSSRFLEELHSLKLRIHWSDSHFDVEHKELHWEIVINARRNEQWEISIHGAR